ncbi:MAG: DUF2442 domain-containing protein [Steroidobacteraceae bacterium]
MVWVTAARACPEYRVWVCFSDGVEGAVDLGEYLRKDHRAIVRALLDPVLFASLRVDLDTVVWSNGFDLAPEFLRDRLLATA